MVRDSYTKLKKKREDRKGWIVIIGVAIFFIAGAIVFINLQKNKPDFDTDPQSKFYLCPKDSPYGYTAILIDKTDPFNKTQVMDIKRKILQERDKLDKYSLLTIFVIGHEKIKIEPIFSICNPNLFRNSIILLKESSNALSADLPISAINSNTSAIASKRGFKAVSTLANTLNGLAIAVIRTSNIGSKGINIACKNPNKSVKNPGIMSNKAAKAKTAPDIISYIGTSFFTSC